MARIRNTMQLVKKSIGHIDKKYSLGAENVEDIYQGSNDHFEMIINGFRFGYMQGMKAAKAEMMKGGVCHE